MFQKKVVEKTETRILCSISPFENCAIYEIMWKKCCTVGQTTDDNMDSTCALHPGYLRLQIQTQAV